MEKLKSLFAAGKEQFDNRCRQVAVGAGAVAFGPLAMAAGEGEVDVSDVLAKIAAGFAAALLVSVSFTGAYLGIRASKLARRG